MTQPDTTVQDTFPEEDPKPFGLDDETLRSVEQALLPETTENPSDLISQLNFAEGAELLEKVSDADRRQIVEEHAGAFDPLTYAELSNELKSETLGAMSPIQIARIIKDLESDDALDLILYLDEDTQKEVIRKLGKTMRAALEEGLSFPEDSAGRLMQREFVAIPQFWTVGKTIDYLRAADDTLPADFYDFFVIDPGYHVKGEIPINKLIRAKRSVKVEDLTLDSVHPIPADMDQEDVAKLFRREGITSAPVVDEAERVIGVITVDDVLDVIDEEAEEDFLKLGGVDQSDLYTATLSTGLARFRWLFINLLTAILASTVISLFDATLDQLVALAILMPIVASMGGNAGTQALTVAVRALAARNLSATVKRRLILKETYVGIINGFAFACIAGGITMLWFGSPALGLIIGAAMIVNLLFAGLCGASIPIVLHKLGSDPAVSSTVLLTTVTDVIGFFAFLWLASIFLL